MPFFNKYLVPDTIVKGTIAAAAVINEIIAVLAAREGFQLAGEIGSGLPDQKTHG